MRDARLCTELLKIIILRQFENGVVLLLIDIFRTIKDWDSLTNIHRPFRALENLNTCLNKETISLMINVLMSQSIPNFYWPDFHLWRKHLPCYCVSPGAEWGRLWLLLLLLQQCSERGHKIAQFIEASFPGAKMKKQCQRCVRIKSQEPNFFFKSRLVVWVSHNTEQCSDLLQFHNFFILKSIRKILSLNKTVFKKKYLYIFTKIM